MKTISALAIFVAMSLALPVPAFAQQTIGGNGAILDGMGAGGNEANRHVFDGPPNADVTSLTTQLPKLKSARGNRTAACALISPQHCRALLRDQAIDFQPF
jgi:hypothetical protein